MPARCRCSRSPRGAIRSWSLDVFVSRQIVFYTSTFSQSACYLTVMGLGGFYVRQVGGEWGRVGQIVFFAGSLVICW